MRPRLLALMLVGASALWGQFSQFAATDDGKQIYFISRLVLNGGTAGPNRLYRIGPDGVVLYAEAPAAGGVNAPQVSGDGHLVAYTAGFSEAQLTGAKNVDLGPGSVQLSRNGRWALLSNQSVLTLIDLAGGGRTDIAVAAYWARGVASDGSVLTPAGIWKQRVTTPLPPTPNSSFTPLALSDDASTVAGMAFVAGQQGSLALSAIDIASAKVTTVRAQTGTQLPLFMGLSNNGKRILYRLPGLAAADGPAYVADLTTGVTTPLTLPANETVLDGTLSGDGAIAILTTNLGRILRVTVASGATEQLIPPTPYIGNLSILAIGSYTPLSTTYPGDWAGAILLDGKPLPVLATRPGEVDVQIPWEQPPGLARMQTNLPTGSPFQQIESVLVSGLAPSFLMAPAGASAIFPVAILKGDWSGYQTTQPKAGDIVYLYMTGLGAVSGPMQTGTPAPLNVAEPIQLPLSCMFTPQTAMAETVFAGLAPGLIGIYQVAFRIPADPNTKPLNGMQCHLGLSASFGFGIFAGATQN